MYEVNLCNIDGYLKVSKFKLISSVWHQKNQTDSKFNKNISEDPNCPINYYSAFSDARFMNNCIIQKSFNNQNSLNIKDEDT